MNTILINPSDWLECEDCSEWEAQYEVNTSENVCVVVVLVSFNWLEIVIAKYGDPALSDGTYYIAVLDGRTAAFGVSDLTDSYELTEKLLMAGMHTTDAITIAQVLSHIGEEASGNG